MNKITLCDYIADQNPEAALAMLDRNQVQYKVPSTKKQVAEILKGYVRNYGEPALMNVASVHPDAELILAANPVETREAREEFSEMKRMSGNPFFQHGYAGFGGCGCGNFSGHMLNFNGNAAPNCPYLGCSGGCSCGGKCGGAGKMNADGSKPMSYGPLYFAIGVVVVFVALNELKRNLK